MAQFRFDCDEDEKARWQRAANSDGQRSLASWVRARLNEAAAQELERRQDNAKKRRPS
jgi:hypothetical protein